MCHNFTICILYLLLITAGRNTTSTFDFTFSLWFDSTATTTAVDKKDDQQQQQPTATSAGSVVVAGQTVTAVSAAATVPVTIDADQADSMVDRAGEEETK